MSPDPISPPFVSEDALAGWEGRRVVITGGLGFIGSSLAQALHVARAEVVIIDALLPLYGGNMFNLSGIEDQVTVHVLDVRSGTQLDAVLSGADVVFHVAAQVSHLDSMTDPDLDADINVLGMISLLRAVSRAEPDATVINVGTRAQYGRVPRAEVDERGPFHPTDFYGVSKHAAEGYGAVWHGTLGMDFRGVRATNVFGPRHQMKHGRYGILNWFIRLGLDGREIPVFGEGRQLRDFLFIDDLVDALLRVGGAGSRPGAIYNVGTGIGIPFRDAAEVVARLTGTTVTREPWPDDRQRIETGDVVCDPALIRGELGWRERVGLEVGLSRTVDYYRTYRSNYW
jgi:nucleoside-diphosphate-sugar epimerase